MPSNYWRTQGRDIGGKFTSPGEGVFPYTGLSFAIKSDLTPDMTNELLLDTFHRWVAFALGLTSIGGHTLKDPSGRYASAITAERDEDGYIVAIHIDDSAEGAKQAKLIEHGHKRFSIKQVMLGKRGGGSLRIRLRQAPTAPGGYKISGGNIGPMTRGGSTRFTKALGKVWAGNYRKAPRSGFVTMADDGKDNWIIPAMPAYHPAYILQQSLPPELRPVVQIPSF